jgi:hypothetical protein
MKMGSLKVPRIAWDVAKMFLWYSRRLHQTLQCSSISKRVSFYEVHSIFLLGLT